MGTLLTKFRRERRQPYFPNYCNSSALHQESTKVNVTDGHYIIWTEAGHHSQVYSDTQQLQEPLWYGIPDRHYQGLTAVAGLGPPLWPSFRGSSP